MDRYPYPDLRPAFPASFVKPSRTSRLLQPGIVLATVIILGCVSLLAVLVAGSVLSSVDPRTSGVNATQAFGLMSSFLSVLYLIFHTIAAIYNEPVGVVRPPALKLHAACFIVARLVLICWFATFIAASATLSKPKVCMEGTRDCHLQIAVVIASIAAVMATGITLTALESCKYPFQMPDIFHIPKRVTVRVSSFGGDFLNRSVSRASSIDNDDPFDTEEIEIFGRESIPQEHINESHLLSGRPLTPLQPILRHTTSRGWGEEWTHLADERTLQRGLMLEKTSEKKVLSHSDSGISLSYDSSSGYISSSESSHVSASGRSGTRRLGQRSANFGPQRATLARRTPRPRIVTPSSSISRFSRRSPLSTMRYAEYPDIVVRPELRYCAPVIPAPHEWNSSRTASLSQLIPVAEVHDLQRRSSATYPEQLRIRKPSKYLPLIPRASTTSLVRRKTSDIRVPGAYVEDRAIIDQDRNLDEHMRKIEAAYVTRRQSNQNLQRRSSLQSNSALHPYEQNLQYRPSFQSRRHLQFKYSVRSDRNISFRNDRVLQCKSLVQSKRTLHHKSSSSTQRTSSMHSDRSGSQKSSVPLPPVDESEKRSPSIRVDSKSRYRGQKPFVHRAQTTIGGKRAQRPARSHMADLGGEETVLFRRLSLGDISPGFGSIARIFG